MTIKIVNVAPDEITLQIVTSLGTVEQTWPLISVRHLILHLQQGVKQCSTLSGASSKSSQDS